MIGFYLLGFAILFYITSLHKLSLFIFATFMLNGWCVLTDAVLGYKNYDLAFIYVIAILAVNLFIDKKTNDLRDTRICLLIGIFIVFLFLDISFSFTHYQFTPYQILQGSRASFLILSYFFLRKLDNEIFIWLNKALFYVTLVTSILYIIEVFYNVPTLPYKFTNVKMDEFTHIMRYYNSPPLLYWYLIVTILFPKMLNSRLTVIAVFVFGTALVATLGRIQIGMTVFVIFVGLILRGRIKTVINALAIFTLLSIPFMQIISLRFQGKYGDESENEVRSMFSGGIQDMANGKNNMDEGTLTYRFAWIYERMLYLSERPISENIYGLGLISDSQVDVVQPMYHFYLGLYSDDGYKQQMTTPDISYGNLLSKYGYLGGFLYLSIWFYLMSYFFYHRNDSDYALAGFLHVLALMLIAFAGTTVSDQGNLLFPFMLLIYVKKKLYKKNQYVVSSESYLMKIKSLLSAK